MFWSKLRRLAPGLVAAALMLGTPAHAQQLREYWIAPNGNDANIGSQAAPWKTLSHALSLCGNGTEELPVKIHVTPGTYARYYNDDAKFIATLTNRSYIDILGEPADGVRPLMDGEAIIPQLSPNDRWELVTGQPAGVHLYRTKLPLCAYCSSPCLEDGCTPSDPLEPARFNCHLTFNGHNYLLLNYGDSHNTLERYGWDNLVSVNNFWEDDASAGNVYMGPGVIFDRNGALHDTLGDEGRLYIRLDPPFYDPPSQPWPLDPDQAELHFSDGKAKLVLKGSPSLPAGGTHHITVSDIDFHMFELTLTDGGIGCSDIEIRNCSFRGFPITHNGIGGDTHNITFDNVTFEDAEIPTWITWDDVKVHPGNNPDFAQCAMNHETHGFLVTSATRGSTTYSPHDLYFTNCTFANLWDGLVINAPGRRHHIYVSGCTFTKVRDDCVQLGSSVGNFEFDHNFVKGPGTAVSRSLSGTAGEPTCDSGDCVPPCYHGTKWIHHNIIDCREPQRFHRQKVAEPSCDPPYDDWSDKSPGMPDGNDVCTGKAWLPPFGFHADQHDPGVENDPRNIYNNTVLAGPNKYGVGYGLYGIGHWYQDTNDDWQLDPPPTTITKQRVFNNIFAIDYHHDLWHPADGDDVINGGRLASDVDDDVWNDAWDNSVSMLLEGNIFLRTVDSQRHMWSSVYIQGPPESLVDAVDFAEFDGIGNGEAPWSGKNIEDNPFCSIGTSYETFTIDGYSTYWHDYVAAGDNVFNCVRGPALLGIETGVYAGALPPTCAQP